VIFENVRKSDLPIQQKLSPKVGIPVEIQVPFETKEPLATNLTDIHNWQRRKYDYLSYQLQLHISLKSI
jgi:hypothetical protein